MHNKEKNIYEGVITAIITPYEKDIQGRLNIDYNAFGDLIKNQIIAGVNGIVVAGSTGEGTCLKKEHIAGLLTKAMEVRLKYKNSNNIDLGDGFSIICGLSSASTDLAIEMLEYINKIGIDGVMITSPHYVKPSRNGARNHFEILASKTDLPIMLYSNKARTGIEIDIEDIDILSSKSPNIIAIKDAENDIMRPLRMYRQVSGVNIFDDLNQQISKRSFNILSGNDENYLAFHAHGGKGIVSVISNVMPKSMVRLNKLLKDGKYDEARTLQCELFDIYDAIYSDANPSAIKYAACLLEICADHVMMPLSEVSDDTKKKIKEILPKLQELETQII